MDKVIKKIINEKFESKKQQRYFYAKANDESLTKKEREKWAKWAEEFSNDTDFDKLPEEADEEEVDEIVDKDGNMITGDEETDANTKYVKSKNMTDVVVKTAHPQIGRFGVAGGGNVTMKYWAEADMSKALGYKDTLGNDEDYEDAKEHFEDELGLSDKEAEERLANMGYDEDLPDDKVRLVENPKTFIEEYLESILSKKTPNEEFVEKEEQTTELNPIIKKQIEALKETLKNNNISISQLIKMLKK